MLGNMLVLGDIEILEHWGKMDSLDLNAFLVLSEDILNSGDFILRHVEVLSSSMYSVIDSDSGNLLGWILLDSVGGEC